MEPTQNRLLFCNGSDQKLLLLINLAYPDSSLARSMVDRYIDPMSEGYVANTMDLTRPDGLTLTVFDYEYYKSSWDGQIRTPDEYLDETEILRRYVYSREELDSLKWRLVYP
jgi:hypothetical protein